MASTSSSSGEELLGVFDHNSNEKEKEKPMKDTYQEFYIEVAWKQQALLELISQKTDLKYHTKNCNVVWIASIVTWQDQLQ
jgi:hypothetical protein